MIKAKVDYEVREYVSGHRHSRGLDTSYDRLTPDERLQEWSKAINLLTIDKSLHLEKKLQVLEGEQARTIQELRAQVDKLTNKIYDRDRRRSGFFDAELKPVADGKKIEITKEEWLEEDRRRRMGLT